MKKCNKCGEIKENNLFYKNRSKKDGLQNACKICCANHQSTFNYKIARKKWNSSDKGKKSRIKYRQSEIGKITLKRGTKKWKETSKGKKTLSNYSKKRRNTDPKYKLSCILRTRLNTVLRRSQKVGSSVLDLGCSLEELKIYLESKFVVGMIWGNHGKWHIDHIVPLSSFDLTDREQLLKACHYTNLQPLWAFDNLSKGSKVLDF